MSTDLTIPEFPDAPPAAAKEGQEAKCWAFMGAMGGVGTSSIIIELAYTAIRQFKDDKKPLPRVCVVDLDFECGTLAHYMDILPGIKLAHLEDSHGLIDTAVLPAFAVNHPCGIDILAAPNRLGGNDKVNPDQVVAMLDAAVQLYDIVILDVPRIWRPWTHAAMAACDKFHLISDLSIPALHVIRQRIEDIEKLAQLRAPLDIIINKYERRAMRSRISADRAEKALGRSITHFICVDQAITSDALNCGEPAASLNKDTRYSHDIEKICTKLLGRRPAMMNVKKRRIFKRRVA